MSLIDQIQADVKAILNDTACSVGVPIVITSPAGVSESFTGFSNDIALLIDPDTGEAVSGRIATIAVSMLSLEDAGFSNPEGIPDLDSKPWVVEFSGKVFRVTESHPDHTTKLLTCTLTAYTVLVE